MGRDILDDPELTGSLIPGTRPGRLARLSPWVARAALVLLFGAIAASLWAPSWAPGQRSLLERLLSPQAHDSVVKGTPSTAASGDDDIRLYEDVTARISRGENYYDFIVPEQRAQGYPVNPAIAVRLPTLAYLSAWLGKPGLTFAALALMVATLVAWWRQFGEDGGVIRRVGTALVFVGLALQLNRYFFVLHELWSGGLLALSFGLHRIGHEEQGGRWRLAWLAAALALAIRELALPYVLLVTAFALWNRNWREASAWIVLIIAFLTGLAIHLAIVEHHLFPHEVRGPSWLVMRGMSGWTSNVIQSSDLRWLPHVLAAPALVLMTFGWLGWRSRSGLFGFLLCAGYGLLFMLAGRWNNFYWGMMIAPSMFAGLVFVPAALTDLWQAARNTEALPRQSA